MKTARGPLLRTDRTVRTRAPAPTRGAAQAQREKAEISAQLCVRDNEILQLDTQLNQAMSDLSKLRRELSAARHREKLPTDTKLADAQMEIEAKDRKLRQLQTEKFQLSKALQAANERIERILHAKSPSPMPGSRQPPQPPSLSINTTPPSTPERTTRRTPLKSPPVPALAARRARMSAQKATPSPGLGSAKKSHVFG